MVGLQTLDLAIGVRVPASQPQFTPCSEISLEIVSIYLLPNLGWNDSIFMSLARSYPLTV